MTNEEVQSVFNAVRLHFTSDYDFFKYRGKGIKVKKTSPRAAFIAKNVKTENQLVMYFVANQIHHLLTEHKYCGFLPSIASDEHVAIWKRMLWSIKNNNNNLVSDLSHFLSLYKLSDLRDVNIVARMFFQKKMNFLTAVQIYKFTGVENYWVETYDPLIDEFTVLVKKVAPFMKFDKENFSEIFNHVLEEVV